MRANDLMRVLAVWQADARAVGEWSLTERQRKWLVRVTTRVLDRRGLSASDERALIRIRVSFASYVATLPRKRTRAA